MDNGFKIKGYFTVQQKMLIMSGLSLEGNESMVYKIYSMTIRLLFIVYLFILVHDVAVNIDDFDVIIDSIYHIMAIITVLSKILMVSRNTRKLNKTLKLLEQGIFAPSRERGGILEEIWISQCVTNSNRLIIVSWILALITLYLSITFTMVKRFTTSDSQLLVLPFGKFSIFNPNRSPNFELAWLYQSIAFPMVAVAYLATDFLVVSVLAHICVQFRMLRNSIYRIVGDGLDKKYEIMKNNSDDTKLLQGFVEIAWDCLAYKLKENVRYHIAIMDLAQQFEDILNTLVLTNYITVAVALGCIMYHGSLYPPSDPRFQKDATIGIAVSFQLFLISYFGNEVTLESELVLSACFEEKFFGIDIKLQKGLNLMMARSQKPTKFTVGKFADLSLVSFVALIRASFSYYMVLHSMNQ